MMFTMEVDMDKRMSQYEVELAGMTPGLEKSVLKVISLYRKPKPVSRLSLVNAVRAMGVPTSERQVREAVKRLRRRGYLICSQAGESGGYYLALTKQEYYEFRQSEFASKIADMAETMTAMDQSARSQFGEGSQMGLFG